MEARHAQGRPSHATDSLKPGPPLTANRLSFAERKAAQLSRPSTPFFVQGDRNLRDIDRAPPGDVLRKTPKPQSRPTLAKQRSNFFEDAFSVKEVNPARDRVRNEAMVVAEVRTNVIINDELTFISELSSHLSTRYQRPISSIAVTLQHGICMLFGGTFDPAYVMSVYALPSQLQPATNKRNASLIQKYMEEALGVVPARGFLRFVPTMEEQVAWKGKTVAGEMDDLDKNVGDRELTADDAMSVASRRSKARKRLSVRSFGTFKAIPAGNMPAPEPTPPASGDETASHMSIPAIPAGAESKREDTKAARRKKSFVASILGRLGPKTEFRPQLPMQD